MMNIFLLYSFNKMQKVPKKYQKKYQKYQN